MMTQGNEARRVRQLRRGTVCSAELGQHVAHDLVARDRGLVPVGRAGRDVQHVARTGLDNMVIETVSDAAGQNKYRMAGLAPIRLGRAWWVRTALLVAQGNTEA